VFFDGERPGEMTAPPVTGEDTDAILAELGRSPEAIAALKDAKVV
jgi:crotonobetainyl-CoA:carnitine CoA-transferase CaiB-like acyl-CoA transferase